jgi:hypothetical protein
VRPTTVQKYIILLARLDGHAPTVIKPPFQLFEGLGRDGYQTLLATLSHHPHILLLLIEVGELQVDKLRDTQSTGEEYFNDGTVAMALPLGEIDAGFQGIHLVGCQHLRQVMSQDG